MIFIKPDGAAPPLVTYPSNANSISFQNPPPYKAPILQLLNQTWFFYKLDGVGPVDNRLYTDKLHHFVYFKKIIKTLYFLLFFLGGGI